MDLYNFYVFYMQQTLLRTHTFADNYSMQQSLCRESFTYGKCKQIAVSYENLGYKTKNKNNNAKI